jgi:hypothetical protein
MTSCSANLLNATGSASKTLVSKTYVIRPGTALIPTDLSATDSLANIFDPGFCVIVVGGLEVDKR